MHNQMSGLTPRQVAAKLAIAAFFREHGYSPTFGEIGKSLGVTAESATKLVDCLERRGHIVRQRGMRRSLALVPQMAA